jgi:hypothetical protein
LALLERRRYSEDWSRLSVLAMPLAQTQRRASSLRSAPNW